MYKISLSLKLITTCEVEGRDIVDFIEKMKSCGFYTYIEDYREDEEFNDDDGIDVMIFKIVQ